ncbi:MAG: hypothetical protein AAF726_04490 [Planctomycetota bacterium]
MHTIPRRAAPALCLFAIGCGPVQQVRLLNAYERTYTNATAADTTTTDVTTNVAPDGRSAGLVSAFFGIDNGLPRPTNKVIFNGAAGKDGMPVVLSHEVDFGTLQAGDIQVTRESGAIGEILCVTLAPADDPGELRTVLVVGEFGSDEDPPVRVDVIGDLLTIDGSANFKGASAEVIPLADGPTIVWAEVVPESEWRVGAKATPLRWGGGGGCPPDALEVVRVTWAGGVTLPGGAEIDAETLGRYRVTVLRPDGETIEVIPFAVADLGDGDNNHFLCLDVEGQPLSVSFPAGLLTDPNEDLNPATSLDLPPVR